MQKMLTQYRINIYNMSLACKGIYRYLILLVFTNILYIISYNKHRKPVIIYFLCTHSTHYAAEPLGIIIKILIGYSYPV